MGQNRLDYRSPGGAKAMAHTYSNLLFHAIFSTKDRAATISPAIRNDLFAYMAGIIRHMGGKTVIAGGTADHVHLLLELPSHLAVADTLRVVKTNSSRWAHERWPERRLFAWQTGYAAFTVSKSNVNAVRVYIANQEAHHKTVDFRDEFRAFLKKNGITCNEKYVME
jgi:REP element-mobilizing transposase RayT